MNIKDRIEKLNSDVDTALAKAASRRSGRPRIPGDGDGDGIPNEGRSRGGKKPGGARKPASFIDVLNNPRGREMVNGIEDTLSSLRRYNGKEPTLQRILSNQVKELKSQFGFEYKHDYS